jgi:hypothetical protein
MVRSIYHHGHGLDEMIRLHDEAYGHIDLHAQEHNIKWDMDYVQSSMRDLPVKSWYVCVLLWESVRPSIRNMLERECTKATKCMCYIQSITRCKVVQ